MDELAVRPPGIIASIRGWVERALGVGLPTYSSSGGGLPATPVYPVDMAMASMSANPWVWACVQAIVTDLSGLPLVAEQGLGLAKTQTYTHWLLDLLDRPSPKISGRRFRRQLVADLAQTGNAYVRVWRGKDGRPVMLGRVIPGLIQANVGVDGEVIDWTLTATGEQLPWAAVLHVSDISWTEDQSLVYGASRIAPLALGLSVDRDSRRQAGRSARRGRLEMMLSPNSPEVSLNKDSVRMMTEQYAVATEEGHGLYVVNKGVTATPLTLTAREGEFLGVSDRLRAEVLAVYGVPPVRAGEPAANYGTARQQMRTYWETLLGWAALIDDELSRLAEPGVRIRHSFANVNSLQETHTERQNRAVVWIEKFGIDPASAAAYEGFHDAPIPKASKTASLEATALNGAQVVAAQGIVQAVALNQLPRESAVAMLVQFFQLDPAAAESVLGPIGTTFFASPPVKDATVVVEQALQSVAWMFDGERTPDVESMALTVIRSALIELGADPELAAEVAASAVAQCSEVWWLQPPRDPVLKLWPFSRAHAEEIARHAGVAA